MSVPRQNVVAVDRYNRSGVCGHIHPLQQGVGCLYCKYIINGWLTRAYLIHHGLVPYECGTIMARNAFLVEMETLLRVTMLYSWLRGDFGPIDDFNIELADIIDVWVELCGVSFYPHGNYMTSKLKFYIHKEKDFWEEMKTGDYRVMPSKPKKQMTRRDRFLALEH